MAYSSSLGGEPNQHLSLQLLTVVVAMETFLGMTPFSVSTNKLRILSYFSNSILIFFGLSKLRMDSPVYQSSLQKTDLNRFRVLPAFKHTRSPVWKAPGQGQGMALVLSLGSELQV